MTEHLFDHVHREALHDWLDNRPEPDDPSPFEVAPEQLLDDAEEVASDGDR
jgi:hypothetical protein